LVPAHVAAQRKLSVVRVELKVFKFPSGVVLLPTNLKNHQEILGTPNSRMQRLLSTRP
jgi:hypothetical protein